MTIIASTEVVIAATQFGETNQVVNKARARTGTMIFTRMTPSPSAAARSVISPRIGSGRPRTTSAMMMRRNGAAVCQPGDEM